MTLNNFDGVPYLTYNSLSEIKSVKHAFSTRLGGVSGGEFASMNLAFNRGDKPENVTENYKRLCKSAGLDFESLVFHVSGIRKKYFLLCGDGCFTDFDCFFKDRCRLCYHRLCSIWAAAVMDLQKGAEL